MIKFFTVYYPEIVILGLFLGPIVILLITGIIEILFKLSICDDCNKKVRRLILIKRKDKSISVCLNCAQGYYHCRWILGRKY